MSDVSAGILRRVAALVYDSLLLVALLMVFTGASLFFTHGNAVIPQTAGAWEYLYRAGLALVIAAYFIGNWIHSGQTLGMRAWHIRRRDLVFRPVFLLFAAFILLCGTGHLLDVLTLAVAAWLPAGLGVLWMYLDPEHLAIHDRLAKTRLIRLPRT